MCWKCKSNITEDFISRSAVCPSCHADLHSCRNCEFYSPGSHFDCHESVNDPVSDKERSNFCESFRVKRAWADSSSSAEDKAREAKRKFDSLFSI